MKIPVDQPAFHKLKIGSLLKNKSFSSRERKISIWGYILHNEIVLGTHFIIGKPEQNIFVRLGATGKIIRIPRTGRGGDQIFSYLYTMYGLTEREDMSKFIYDSMRSYAIEEGSYVELRRFSAYDHSTQTTYLSAYNGFMWRLDGSERIVRLPTGDDNKFFVDDDGGICVEPEIGSHGLLINHLTNLNFAEQGLGGITSEQQRKAIIVWIFSLAFPDLMPTKPLLMLEGSQGSGKCLKKGTFVIKANGQRVAVETIKTGDRLMGPDGKARIVKSTTSGYGPLYQITPTKGEPWICNDAHILTLACSDNDSITDMNIDKWNSMKPWLQNRFKQFSVSIDKFETEINLPVDPYFLGLWFGDGTKQINNKGILSKIAITKPDIEVKLACEEIAKSWHIRLNYYTSTGGCPTYCLVTDTQKNPLLDAFRSIINGKILIPKSYLLAPRNERLQFLAGLLDSDGEMDNNCFYISQNREDWARDIWWLARSLGFSSIIRTRKAGFTRPDGTKFEGTYWVVTISGNTDLIPTRIPRKQAKPRKQIKIATRTGITVTPAGDGEYFGFELDGDGRFLLDDFTVTHNSAAVQLIQVALMGQSKPMTISKNQEADFGVLLLRSPIAVLDNVDSYIDWVADKVCSYTTNGQFPKRKLYSDDEEVVIRPHAFIAVASKNPASFRREDVADRCVIIRLDRRDSFVRFQRLEQETIALRSKLVGEYIYLCNQIVKEIRGGAYNESDNESHRMADFSALARVVARVMGWTVDDVKDLMIGLQGERDAFINEEDPLVELLHKWINYRPRIGPGNIGREVTIHELFKELDSFAQAEGIQWYKSPRMLAQKIRSQHVDRDFIVQMLATDGHKSYKIWRRTDAQLTTVPEDKIIIES